MPTLRVLVILTFRPELALPWVGRPHVTMLILNRLPLLHRAAMIAHVAGGKALPKEIAAQIVDRTDGVPLFIEELTKAMLESGLLTETGDRYEVTGAVIPAAIPTTLHASLLARLDRLAPTREVAQIAAAIGREFSYELISAVAAMPQPRLDDALAQLVSAELMFQRGTLPAAEYTFKHVLVQEAAYGTLLRSSRQQLAALQPPWKTIPEITEMQPGVLARHCTEAGLAEKAIKYWYSAGEQAVRRASNREAIGHFRQALALTKSSLLISSVRAPSSPCYLNSDPHS